MPSFWAAGKSPLPKILGGDPSLQRDALWQYLARGPEARRPAGIQLEPLELAVGEEAVMLRRSYPDIGKRGIGVGYPNGVNLSFDAGQLRLASIWQGGFIEASGVWRGQGHGRVRILGDNTVKFPEGPAFAGVVRDEGILPGLPVRRKGPLAEAAATWPAVLDEWSFEDELKLHCVQFQIVIVCKISNHQIKSSNLSQ